MMPMFVIAGIGAGPSTPNPDLSDINDPLLSTEVSPTSDRPISAIKFLTNGDIEEATGDTGEVLSYSKVGTWLPSVPIDSSDWELNFTIDSETGAAGTWTGSTTDSYVTLDSIRTFLWTKDTTSNGTANSEVTCTVRQVSDTGNSASRSNLTYTAEISA